MSATLSSRAKASKFATLRRIYGDVCWICDEAINFDLPRDHVEAGTLDHVISRCDGGTNENTNLRLAHRVCNEARGKLQHENGQVAA